MRADVARGAGEGKLDNARPYPLKDHYTAVYALLGILPLKFGIALAVVTGAKVAAVVAGHSIYRVTAAQVVTAHGALPSDRGDAR